ncbi:MAG: RNA-binding S4 domain-containing protein [Wenzhouxiangellaceae bacterium]
MDSVRIDKWLWAARFFKTRSMAQKAVRGGHIELNDHSCKPARLVSVGDRLRVTRGDLAFEIDVIALSERRGPAVEARTLYAETANSIERRRRLVEQQRLVRQSAPDGRPDKRGRRRIRSFSGKDG